MHPIWNTLLDTSAEQPLLSKGDYSRYGKNKLGETNSVFPLKPDNQKQRLCFKSMYVFKLKHI